MSGLPEKLSNLLEYFGILSGGYYLSRPPILFDKNDPLVYYLDHSARAEYNGPVDDLGIPLYSIGDKKVIYLPVQIMLYALGVQERYRQNGNEEDLVRFEAAVSWIVTNQQQDGAWLTPVPMPRFNLARDWRSAMIQGLAISCLVRAHRLSGDNSLLDAAIRSLKVFHVDIHDGGVSTCHDSGPFYEEYPCHPGVHVLNGFIFAMWGLYDLVRFENNKESKYLWESGLRTLINWLPKYDNGHWSLYHIPAEPPNPATVKYHALHIDQLKVMYAITDEPIFNEYAVRWQNYSNKRFGALRTLPAKLRWYLKTS